MLLNFDFRISNSTESIYRVFVELKQSADSSIVVEGFLTASKPCGQSSRFSLYGAAVSEIRQHCLLRITSCNPRSIAQPLNVSALNCGNVLPLNACFSPKSTDEGSQHVITQDSDPSGLVLFSYHTGSDGAVHPELCLTSNLCSCLDANRWATVGRIYKGLDIVHHVSSLPIDKTNGLINPVVMKSCGFWQPKSELDFIQNKEDRLDQWPDSPRDAQLNFTDLDSIMGTVYGIKTAGSVLFRQEKYHMAKFKFTKAIKYINFSMEKRCLLREQQSRLFDFMLPCILNSAACKLKMKDFDGALEDCNEAMEFGPHDPKVYFRRGQAHHGKLNYDQSLYDLYRALKLSPHDKSIKSEIAAVEGELQVYRKDILRKASSST